MLTVTEQPPQSFTDQVRQVLEHLYDFPFLQRHAFTPYLTDDTHDRMPGQRLRLAFIQAINILDPDLNGANDAPQSRTRRLMQMHYIDGMTIQEAAHELSISVRQAYRDLQHGIESVAMFLWAQFNAGTVPDHQQTQKGVSPDQSDVEPITLRIQSVDAHLLIQKAIGAVERLASQRNVTLHSDLDPHTMLISTDPIVAQQVLVSILSRGVQQAASGKLTLIVKNNISNMTFLLDYGVHPDTNDEPFLTPLITQLAERLNWIIEHEVRSPNQHLLKIKVMADRSTVLVIDDNIALLERFLTGYRCQLVAAYDGYEGLRRCEELQPDVVILDVMMPRLDGWDMLQKMQSNPTIAHIPVIVSSVFNDPELARSLGAALFLAKPIRQTDLLAALNTLNILQEKR